MIEKLKVLQKAQEVLLAKRPSVEKRFWFDNGEWYFLDGWHRYNPHNVLCEECGSWDVEWLWHEGEVVGFHCNKCGEESLDK